MNQNPEWYIIRVVSGTEEKVKNSLFQRRESFGLNDYILDVFIPIQEEIVLRAKGDSKIKKKNIFPGYILVQMIITNECWYIVRNTPNVTGFLGAGNVPVPVTGEELERLKNMLEQNSQVYTTKLNVGDNAKITKGVFEGNQGIITEINEKKGYVKLNINLMGRDTPIEVDFSHIKII